MSFNKELVAGIHSQLCEVVRDTNEVEHIEKDWSFFDYVRRKVIDPLITPWNPESQEYLEPADAHTLCMAAAYAFDQIKEGRYKVADGVKELFARKNHDYGDSYAHARIEVPGYFAGKIYDKLSRFMTLCDGEPAMVAESVNDTLTDLGNYCLMEAAHIIADKVESLGDFGMAIYNGVVVEWYIEEFGDFVEGEPDETI